MPILDPLFVPLLTSFMNTLQEYSSLSDATAPSSSPSPSVAAAAASASSSPPPSAALSHYRAEKQSLQKVSPFSLIPLTFHYSLLPSSLLMSQLLVSSCFFMLFPCCLSLHAGASDFSHPCRFNRKSSHINFLFPVKCPSPRMAYSFRSHLHE